MRKDTEVLITENGCDEAWGRDDACGSWYSALKITYSIS